MAATYELKISLENFNKTSETKKCSAIDLNVPNFSQKKLFLCEKNAKTHIYCIC